MTTSTAGPDPVDDTFPGLTAIQAIVEVMRRVQFVAKDQKMDPRAGMGNYAFRGIDDVVNAVGPALREVGMVIIPDEVLDLSYETVEVGQGDKRKPAPKGEAGAMRLVATDAAEDFGDEPD